MGTVRFFHPLPVRISVFIIEQVASLMLTFLNHSSTSHCRIKFDLIDTKPKVEQESRSPVHLQISKRAVWEIFVSFSTRV